MYKYLYIILLVISFTTLMVIFNKIQVKVNRAAKAYAQYIVDRGY